MVNVYFAHPITDYNTEKEEEVLDFIEIRYGWHVVNPNVFFVKEEYDKQGMEYFKSFVQDCDALIYTRFFDGSIGAGVYKEICWAIEAGLPVYEYIYDHNDISDVYTDINSIPGNILSVEATKMLLDRIRNSHKLTDIISFNYKNYEGVISVRNVIPKYITFTSNKFHPERTWLLNAYDLSRKNMRTFDLLNVLDKDGNPVFTRGNNSNG